MTKLWQKFNAWLDKHPWFHGLFVAVEASVVASVASVIDDFMRGKDVFSTESLRKTLIFVLSGIAIGVRNYLKQSPIPMTLPPSTTITMSNGPSITAETGSLTMSSESTPPTITVSSTTKGIQ